MQHHIDKKMFHIEILSPKQKSQKLEEDLASFADKYRRAFDAGHVICIPDNPMGNLAFQGIELIQELGLPVHGDQVSVHINTFHTKRDLDAMLTAACDLGISHMLVISGDGSPRLPKLTGKEVGYDVEAVTSVELLRYIRREYPGKFHIGVAFNPYEPQDHELEKMHRKVDAGAEFITTQPVIESHPAVESLWQFGLPVVIECWMSKKIHLLSECVGYEIPEDTPYDPVSNLQTLMAKYPKCGFYLAILGFKTQFPILKDVWK
ncbi:MAG TPA: methylenetetrahydrofolate reductase [Phycisphaerae bacterium]|nr:methylenetetrahydrofolate reductase [Phycisphaerae bacterium]